MSPALVVYRLLSFACPRAFRREYWPQMSAMFEAMPLGERVLASADMLAVGARERAIIAARDLRDAARALMESPIVSGVVVLAFAIGIGATTAAFSILDAAILRPLPYPHAERLAKVALSFPFVGDSSFGYVSPQVFDILRARTQSELEMGEFYTNSVVFRTGARPTAVSIGFARGDFFDLVGAHITLGRGLTPDDARRGAARVVVLSDPFWRAHFGANPHTIGSSVRIDDEDYRVVGIAAPGIVVPYGIDKPDEAVAWLPLKPVSTPDIMFTVSIARLRNGVSFDAAQHALTGAVVASSEKYPTALKNRRLLFDPLAYALERELYPRLVVISLAVAGLFVVVCATIATMLLARGSARSRSNAVRVALGASRGRIIAAVTAESLLLAFVGGAFGVTFACMGLSLITSSSLDIVPAGIVVALDARIMAFVIPAVFACAFASAAVPALTLSAVNPACALHDGERASTDRGSAARAALVVIEVAIAVALVSVGALVVRSYVALGSVDVGFRNDGLRLVRLAHISPPQGAGRAAMYATFANHSIETSGRLLSRVRSTPGIEKAEFASTAPMSGFTYAEEITIHGRTLKVGSEVNAPRALTNVVSDGYFRLLSIPVMLGRAFSASDTASSATVAVVSAKFARKLLHTRNPIGITIGINEKNLTIVGVVDDVYANGPRYAPPPIVYIPSTQTMPPMQTLIVKASLPQAVFERDIDSAVRETAPEEPDPEFDTIDHGLALARSSEYSTMMLLGALSAIVLFLALAGVWGIVAYGVAQRSHEFGIRLALGARPQRLVADVVFRTARMFALGIAIGIVLACVGSRFVSDLLFGVGPIDATTFSIVALALAIVALGAAWIPARRASRIDPMRVLRFE